ncbi:unnamed protein product [Gongylonema pulchrum]|uniref:G_PROTEIN_RECEP_F1_2 domain-containing protein n=1 Tax=Gongylonema pulchrum TaxID=637853 RepID=A0A183D7K3_9BILA|nr:unnamed protein product [Gongylonema pulchrum]
MVTSAAINVYAAAEIVLSLHISISNFIVLWVYLSSDHVRTVTNTYIFSLAITDFLAGTVGIPLTVYSVVTGAPHSFAPCVAIHSVLCVLCTISTFHLLAIAVDKYMSICCKSQKIIKQVGRNHRAVVLLASAWIVGSLVAILPLLWFSHFRPETELFSGDCRFTEVVDYRYLVYVIFFGTIVLPTFIFIYCYASIYSRIRTEEQQIRCLLRGRERERRLRGRRKLISILLLLVLTYGVCWYPLYTINTIDMFFPELHSDATITLSAVVLSHVSCAVNPLIYAYGVPGFKQALQAFIRRSSGDCGRRLLNRPPLSGIFSEQSNSVKQSSTISPKYSGALNGLVNLYSRQGIKLPRKISEPVPLRDPAQAYRRTQNQNRSKFYSLTETGSAAHASSNNTFISICHPLTKLSLPPPSDICLFGKQVSGDFFSCHVRRASTHLPTIEISSS